MTRLVLWLVVALALPVAAEAQRDTLVVSARLSAPFVMEAPNGQLEGIAVWLWDEVADEIGVETRWEPVELDALFENVAAGEADVGVGALTITAARERRVDFTHPYLTAGLGVAAAAGEKGILRAMWRIASSPDAWQAFMPLMLLLTVVGLLAWMLEARSNAEEFGGGPARGIGNGFWWAAVTMTTVGYGDKSPRTFGGRVLAVIWMFTAIIIISGITAAITSTLTSAALTSRVESVGDLRTQRVGALAGSTSAAFLDAEGIEYEPLSAVAAGLRCIQADELDAVVHDRPVLGYLTKEEASSKYSLLPLSFEPQAYGFVVPPGDERREAINRALLSVMRSDDWLDVLERYRGL